MDPLKSIAQIAASGMHAQSSRLQIVAENVANSDTTAKTPGGDPYRRKTISFAAELDLDDIYELRANARPRPLSVVAAENYFLRRYRASIEDESIDSKLKPLLTDMERIVQKVTAKFRDLDHCLAGEFHRVPLIYLSLASDGKHVFTDVDGRELRAGNIDGHHRFFIAQVLGLKTIAYMTSERRPEFTRKIKSSYSLS